MHGLEGLWVVDASVMPHITNAIVDARVIMIAGKAADLIRGAAPLPPEHVDFYRHQLATQASQNNDVPRRTTAVSRTLSSWWNVMLVVKTGVSCASSSAPATSAARRASALWTSSVDAVASPWA